MIGVIAADGGKDTPHLWVGKELVDVVGSLLRCARNVVKAAERVRRLYHTIAQGFEETPAALEPVREGSRSTPGRSDDTDGITGT